MALYVTQLPLRDDALTLGLFGLTPVPASDPIPGYLLGEILPAPPMLTLP